MRHFLFVSMCLGFMSLTPHALAEEKKAEADEVLPELPAPKSQAGEVTIDGKKVSYEVTAGKLRIEKGKKPTLADIFYTSYVRSDTKDLSQRPVMFAFNGGPGSSAVWLHIGMLGPRIVDLPGDGTEPPQPPVGLKDNPMSMLDACDLVFIDPVSTGYSRAQSDGDADEFHGLNEDIESVGEFIRRWVTEHKRWSSPKYLLGESYGGIRAVGLAKHLQSRFGMNLNGLVMLSSLMDFATLQGAQGNDLVQLVFLPAFCSVAITHGKVAGPGEALVKKARDYAYGDYAAALVQGSSLDAARRKQVAMQLEQFTGIAAETWEKHRLRINPTLFRAELLRDEGKTIGRFDGRVAWDKDDTAAEYPQYDPSYALSYAAFSSAMNDYLGRELGYFEDKPYEILTGEVHPWKWNSQNAVVNVSDRLHRAMRDNPQLRVLVMSGQSDLATPPESMAYSLRHMLELSDQGRQRIRTTDYAAGHMFYLNPADLKKARADLLEFIR